MSRSYFTAKGRTSMDGLTDPTSLSACKATESSDPQHAFCTTRPGQAHQSRLCFASRYQMLTGRAGQRKYYASSPLQQGLPPFRKDFYDDDLAHIG